MSISWVVRVFLLSLLLWSCIGKAIGQSSCNADPFPPDDGCIRIFSVWPADYVPPGTHCFCDGVPRVSALCHITQCSRIRSVCPTCAGSPIALATGNTFIEQSDVRVPGLGSGLVLTRTWNSVLTNGAIGAGLFGPHWRSTYEERVFLDSDDTMAYARGDGSLWSFVYDQGQSFRPVAPANIVATLTEGTTGWTVAFQNGEQRTFDIDSGKLTSIKDRNGNITLLSYDSADRLASVADPASRHHYFTYANSSSTLVTAVSTDVGISLSYSYDSQGRLAHYTKPDNTSISFQYNNQNPDLITAVIDSEGKVLESHTYDSAARGLTSSRATGVDALTIHYRQ